MRRFTSATTIDPVRLRAVIFDLDGVLVDSEQLWDQIRRDVVAEHGGQWAAGATEAMLGMSTPEWSDYLVRQLGARLTPDQAAASVIERMAQCYAQAPPLLPHATDTVREVAATFPVAIASSAPPQILRAFLQVTKLDSSVSHTVSSEEVGAGKPAPDVYLEAAQRLAVPATACAAIEDSSNGLRAAAAAGTTVLALPNAHFPPADDALAHAHRVLSTLVELPATLQELDEALSR
jgi:HAD superfamily hydrolase (TIGR01509 family)